jgi:Haem-binding domain
MKKIILWLVIGLVALFVLIQLVPYGRNHSDPPVVKEPQWDSPQTRELAKRACFDCHSNESVWPWYSNIAPVSWLIQRDVDEGRRRLNFSEWGRPIRRINEIGEVVTEGRMPPVQYYPTHPSARLSAAEREALAKGLIATISQSK